MIGREWGMRETALKEAIRAQAAFLKSRNVDGLLEGTGGKDPPRQNLVGKGNWQDRLNFYALQEVSRKVAACDQSIIYTTAI
jgi:hypothetical protein